MRAEALLDTRSSLDIQAVSKSYRVDGKPREILRDIRFTVEPGEFVSVIGASGCGKSTLLRLIIGLDTDYDGDILLDGRSIDGPAADRGIVFQEPRLFPWLSVEQNIALGLDSSGASPAEVKCIVAEHIEIVRLNGFARAYPHQLSGGMAQRAAIARALVSRPKILLLDEPLGALDSQTRAYMQDELLDIWRREKITIVMVTHDIEEAVYLSDKIVVMEPEPGRVCGIVSIDAPHPRRRGTSKFSALKDRVLSVLVRTQSAASAGLVRSHPAAQGGIARRYG
jgi:ABC-type nitrate/sulfonate/bicarbonate transport system ATPase subunit